MIILLYKTELSQNFVFHQISIELTTHDMIPVLKLTLLTDYEWVKLRSV